MSVRSGLRTRVRRGGAARVATRPLRRTRRRRAERVRRACACDVPSGATMPLGGAHEGTCSGVLSQSDLTHLQPHCELHVDRVFDPNPRLQSKRTRKITPPTFTTARASLDARSRLCAVGPGGVAPWPGECRRGDGAARSATRGGIRVVRASPARARGMSRVAVSSRNDALTRQRLSDRPLLPS